VFDEVKAVGQLVLEAKVMLSAFKPRPLVELKPRDKSKIESILASGDRLLVGLNNGCLRIYQINETSSEDEEGKGNGHALENESPPKDDLGANEPTTQPTASKAKPTDLLREQEKFSRYKIEQLAVIKEAKLLISLSGGYVSIHDLQTYQLQEQLSRTKSASSFAVTSNIINDPETGVPLIVSRLAVAVKRKILFWAWQDMELSTDTAEIILVSGIKTLTWVSGKKLVAGLSTNHVMVDIETMGVIDLVGPGSIGGASGQETSRLGGVASMSYIGMGSLGPKPLATRLKEGQILLAKDINTHFIDINGNSLGRRQIPWGIAPEAIGYSYPYLLALQDSSKGILEIRNPETLSLLQSISLPSASLMHIPQPNISLAHAGKDFLVASDRVIWRMEALSYDSQIDALVEGGYLDEAISLISMLEDALLKDKSSRLREVKLQKAENLFNTRKYRDALDLFAEVSAPPEVVIGFYPRIIAGELSSVIEDQEENDSSGDELRKQPNGVQAQAEGSGTEDAAANRNSVYAPSLASFLRGKTDEGSDSGSVRGKQVDAVQRDQRLRMC
jgi:Vam6/Vps39-like protein vacuolar protein sorting-associated protein 39